ncbi:MAG TPA: hypothetical protein DDZ51_29980 [Planctomycetaceae bacterium]|nr:hypothetical protein [Planctomycetaceae bacterium]
MTDKSDDFSSDQNQLVRKTRSKQKFVIAFLCFHMLLTICVYRFDGLTGGLLLSPIYEYYFVYTSMPSIFIIPFLPASLKLSPAVFACLLINGTMVVWLSSSLLHDWIYRKRNHANLMNRKEV